MDNIRLIWEFLKGKKTYIAAVALLVYGLIEKNGEAVLMALGLFGLRNGVSHEVGKLK